jgi:hypothetical protein
MNTTADQILAEQERNRMLRESQKSKADDSIEFGKPDRAKRFVGDRGSCPKCGQLGHMASQCRNMIKLDDDDDDVCCFWFF